MSTVMLSRRLEAFTELLSSRVLPVLERLAAAAEQAQRKAEAPPGPRWFLYLAPGYYDEAFLYDGIDARAQLLDHGATARFLDEAEPGDVEALHKRDRWVIRLGRCFNDGVGGWIP